MTAAEAPSRNCEERSPFGKPGAPSLSRNDEAIQSEGSPRLLVQARDDGVRMAITAEASPHTTPEQSTATETRLQDAWRVVVLNDPVNLMSYVVMVFKKVFGFDETKARKHMLEVHEQGRSIVWRGAREPAEAYVFSLHQWHLTAVLERDEMA
jgi:ATP-dependent Clp protease adaptor protein ClpS